MVAANVLMTIRYQLFPKAFEYATVTDGLQVTTINGLALTRYKHFCVKNPKFAQHLRTWGEAGTVKTKANITPKIAERGVQCMFIGYAKDHEGDCYQMWNPKTSGVHSTRYVIWLRQMFYSAPEAVPEIALEPDDDIIIVTPVHKIKADNPNDPSGESVDDDDSINIGDDDDEEKMPQLIPQTNEDSDSEDEDDDEDSDSENENNKGQRKQQGTGHRTNLIELSGASTNLVQGQGKSGRVVRAPIWYRDREIGAMLANTERMDIKDAYVQAEIASAAVNAREWEPVLSPAEAKYLKAMEEIDGTDFGISNEDANEYAAVGAGLGGGFTNTAELRPMKYNEALNGPDHQKWQTAFDKEHNRMIKFVVCEAVRRGGDLKIASKIITSTWAMKKKASGTYRARLKARGFEQREGQHYDGTSISATGSNEMVICIVLVLMIMAGWVGEIFNVQGAFLQGEFDQGEEIHMEVPQGFERHYDPMYYVMLLLKTIYGLKQSAFQCWKAILLCFSSMGFVRSKADPCMYYKWSREGLVLWVSWIDDCLVMGPMKADD
jgi:hypothetical protein